MVWHTAYDTKIPPPKPSNRHVRFVLLSDTHGTEPEVPDGDVLLHSGDLTDMGNTKAFEAQLAWLDSLPHRHKFVIAGNHDFGLCTRDRWYETRGTELHQKYHYDLADTAAIKKLMKKWQSREDITQKYLEDERAEFEVQGRRWSIYGSPWTPEFGGWAWNYKRGQQAKDVYAALPSTDILLTHGPPFQLGNLDIIHDGITHVGCEELTEKLRKGHIRPLLHCFGHIHEAQGTHLETWKDSSSATKPIETLCVNAALVEFDLATFLNDKRFCYSLKNQPVLVDIDSDADEFRAPSKLHDIL